MDHAAFTIAAIVIIAAAITAITIAIAPLCSKDSGSSGARGARRELRWFTPEHKRVGTMGERAAQRAVSSVLREGDHLFTNVCVEFDGRSAELDLVVVNKYGVFIIEVKNYTGHIVGSENDGEWLKYKTTPAGMTYEKTVRNPIKQVMKRFVKCFF